MPAESTTDIYTKTKTVIRRSTAVAIPVGVIVGLAVTVVWFLRDDALARITKAEQRGEDVRSAQEAQERRLIRLETQSAGMSNTLGEIREGQKSTNDKLDRLIERLARH